jgi:hypothetical protein
MRVLGWGIGLLQSLHKKLTFNMHHNVCVCVFEICVFWVLLHSDNILKQPTTTCFHIPSAVHRRNRDSSVVLRWAKGWMIGGSSPDRDCKWYLYHHVQTGPGAHPVSYPVGTSDSFSGSKVAGSWSWPLTSIQCRGKECMELYHQSPNTPL